MTKTYWNICCKWFVYFSWINLKDELFQAAGCEFKFLKYYLTNDWQKVKIKFIFNFFKLCNKIVFSQTSKAYPLVQILINACKSQHVRNPREQIQFSSPLCFSPDHLPSSAYNRTTLIVHIARKVSHCALQSISTLPAYATLVSRKVEAMMWSRMTWFLFYVVLPSPGS